MSQTRETYPYFIVLSRAILKGWAAYSESLSDRELLSIPVDMALEIDFKKVEHIDEVIRTISEVITGITLNMRGREQMLRFLETSRDELDRRKRELANKAA